MRRFDGKTALVTGASRGLGRAVAVALGAEGAFVWIGHRASLKVGEHPNRASGGLRRLADAAQVSFMIGIVAMTHVESGDIHSCGNQLRQALGA